MIIFKYFSVNILNSFVNKFLKLFLNIFLTLFSFSMIEWDIFFYFCDQPWKIADGSHRLENIKKTKKKSQYMHDNVLSI